MQTRLTKSYKLRCSHSLPIPNESFHGHNYQLEVTLQSTEKSEDSGMLYSRDELDHIVNERIIYRFDKKHLNNYFEHTSGECLAKYFFDILKESDLGSLLYKVKLQETLKNSFECGL